MIRFHSQAFFLSDFVSGYKENGGLARPILSFPPSESAPALGLDSDTLTPIIAPCPDS